jgi:hypothetical protein
MQINVTIEIPTGSFCRAEKKQCAYFDDSFCVVFKQPVIGEDKLEACLKQCYQPDFQADYFRIKEKYGALLESWATLKENIDNSESIRNNTTQVVSQLVDQLEVLQNKINSMNNVEVV